MFYVLPVCRTNRHRLYQPAADSAGCVAFGPGTSGCGLVGAAAGSAHELRHRQLAWYFSGIIRVARSREILSAKEDTLTQFGAHVRRVPGNMGDIHLIIALPTRPSARGCSPPATPIAKKKTKHTTYLILICTVPNHSLDI